MRADELLVLFGDTVTLICGNPYTGKQLTTDELDRISDMLLVAIFNEKARMYASQKGEVRSDDRGGMDHMQES